MALANSNVIAWDFKSASSPLASKIGQAETFTNNSASVSTANGVRTTDNNIRLDCTNGGFLTGWSPAYTYIVACRPDTALGGPTGSYNFAMRRDNSNNMKFGARGNSATLAMRDIRYDDGWAISDIASAFVDATVQVFVIELRANGAQVWRDGSSIGSGSSTTRTTTFSTTDHIMLGSPDGTSAMMDYYAFALVPGTLSAGDLANMTPANYYTTIFGSSAVPLRPWVVG